MIQHEIAALSSGIGRTARVAAGLAADSVYLSPPYIGRRRPTLSVTASIGPLGFAGVMYPRFEPLAGAQLGVPADLNRVQCPPLSCQWDRRGTAVYLRPHH